MNEEEIIREEEKRTIKNSELMPEQNSNSNHKRFRNYMGKKKKYSRQQPKEVNICRRSKEVIIRTKTKDGDIRIY
jgi:hypothetical protein